jgi:hypothetical protein
MWVVCRYNSGGIYYQKLEDREREMQALIFLPGEIYSKVVKQFPTEEECKKYMIEILKSDELINNILYK